MAATTKTGKRPICPGQRKNGSACNSYAQESGLCAYHSGASAPTAPIPAPAEEPPAPEPEQASERRGRRPAPTSEGVRQAFREDAAENYQVMVDALLEGLAEKTTVFITCPGCSKRHPHIVPALAGRVKAVEALVSLGYGRPREEPREAPDTDPLFAEIQEMTPERLEARSLVLLAAFVEDRVLKEIRAGLTAAADHDQAAVDEARAAIRQTVTELFLLDEARASRLYAELDEEIRQDKSGGIWSSWAGWFH